MHWNNPARKQIPWDRLIFPMLLVLVVYLWFISAGKWTSWPKTSIYDYYSSLASAFHQGHLYLDDKPSAQLLSLPDPYRIGARKDIPYIWDASLYHGRYYLYWGPVPALVLLPVKCVFPNTSIGDNALAFVFIFSLYLVLCILLCRIWYLRFDQLPEWTLEFALIVAGLMPPLTWMLNRPEVYEAAIAAGQFFLLGGFCCAYAALDREGISIWLLLIASTFWGLAIGSRNSEIFPVVFLTLTIGITILLRSSRPWVKVLPAVAALLLPVALCGLALCWYNWARFGSIFEFGYRYQLTLLQLPKHYDELFSGSYIVPNAYNYFLNMFTISNDFPFIKPQYGRILFSGLGDLPRIYFSEAITGLLYTFPLMLMALVNLIPPRQSNLATGVISSNQVAGVFSFGRLLFALTGIFFLELSTLLTFFFATERYLATLMPALMILSFTGFWQACVWLTRHPPLRRILCILFLITALVSLLTTNLLSISSYQERFQSTNPALIEQINRLFHH